MAIPMVNFLATEWCCGWLVHSYTASGRSTLVWTIFLSVVAWTRSQTDDRSVWYRLCIIPALLHFCALQV